LQPNTQNSINLLIAQNNAYIAGGIIGDIPITIN